MTLNIDACISELVEKQRLLDERVLYQVCSLAREILAQESNVVSVNAPITVVGDVHGQYFDVLEIFKIGGMPPDTNYLFLGDYVDRGYYSVETMTLLLCMKVRWPHRVYLIRGNHESRSVTQVYGFYNECHKKYNSLGVWNAFVETFDFLPLSVVISDSYFCVHGGLSPYLQNLDQIRVLDRFQEIPHEGPISDLMWSDPDPVREEFTLSSRGAGFTFGAKAVSQFLQTNNMHHILRAHQLCMEGFQVFYDEKLSTVWSAPNYCYRCGNLASIMEVGPNLSRHFNVFSAAPEQSREAASGGEVPDPQVIDYFL